MGRNRADRRPLRHKEAELRQAAWAQLTDQQKLEELDNRLGKGLGATKQRKRIAKAIEKAKVKV